MKTLISGRFLKARTLAIIQRLGVAALILWTSINASAQATVTTLTDSHHGKPGYKNGNTFANAQFRNPAGIALDPSGENLFLADYNNNAIRLISAVGDTSSSYTYSVYTNNDGINHPIAVAIDANTNIFVLNYGNGKNGNILEFSGAYLFSYALKYLITTNASGLTNATSIALDNSATIYVTIQSNTVIRITNGLSSIVGVITNQGTSLRGIVVLQDGKLALTDAGNNGIWKMDPSNPNIFNNSFKFTGFKGASDFTGPPGIAAFNRPENIAKAGNGFLVVADYNNAKVKVIDANGNVSLLYGISPKYWTKPYPGWRDGLAASLGNVHPAQARQPYGLAVARDSTVYVTENHYHLLREATGTGLPILPPPPPSAPTIYSVVTNIGQVTLTWSAVTGATNYNVKKSPTSGKGYAIIANTTATTYTDTNVMAGETNYYVVSALNTGGESPNSTEVMVVVPIPPPPTPRIGWYDYESTSQSQFVSVLHPVSGTPFISNNDLHLAIDPNTGNMNSGLATYYTTDGSDPSPTNGSTPPQYSDGIVFNQVDPLPVPATSNLVIKALSISLGGSSAIATAQFIYQVGNPFISGNNAAQFTISDVTSGAQFLYTTDGSDPRTNVNAILIGPVSGTNSITLSLPFPSNTNSMLFQIVGIKDNYYSSAVVSESFSQLNYQANTISFGFTSGEASSDFIGASGQFFVAPVTLTTLPGTVIYSLQFNIMVTNSSIVTNAGPPITPGSFDFQSMLLKPLTNTAPVIYTPILPYMFDGTDFVSLETVNTNLNLLGIGWIERFGKTSLYDTIHQTLITYSQAHDDFFPTIEHPNGVMLGAYAFQIPLAATNGQQYEIKIDRASATSDGIGAPGGGVIIATPTNGATAGASPLSALKYVTVGQRKYIAGDVYPFRWFNAGDFGYGDLVTYGSADAEQVFQSAIYSLNTPPYDASSTNTSGGYTNVSDFFDGMDSCGNFGVVDTDVNDINYGYYTNTYVSLNGAQLAALFDGNDTTIDQVVFGDGILNVCDVYVTYRRSLNPSLSLYSRFWNNGQRVAESAPNVVASHVLNNAPSTSIQSKAVNHSTTPPQVDFAAKNVSGKAGQKIKIPITTTILGSYPLRVLMLDLNVTPLDGSPELTTKVQFTQAATALGAPFTTDSRGNGDYSSVWLNSTSSGLSGANVVIGYLFVTIPAGATSGSTYAVHFGHASASPNGLASFPTQTTDGLITVP